LGGGWHLDRDFAPIAAPSNVADALDDGDFRNAAGQQALNQRPQAVLRGWWQRVSAIDHAIGIAAAAGSDKANAVDPQRGRTSDVRVAL